MIANPKWFRIAVVVNPKTAMAINSRSVTIPANKNENPKLNKGTLMRYFLGICNRKGDKPALTTSSKGRHLFIYGTTRNDSRVTCQMLIKSVIYRT